MDRHQASEYLSLAKGKLFGRMAWGRGRLTQKGKVRSILCLPHSRTRWKEKGGLTLVHSSYFTPNKPSGRDRHTGKYSTHNGMVTRMLVFLHCNS